MSLEDFPLAQCNNGDPAVYYRPELEAGEEPPKKLLIYLKGGGVCFPNQDDFRVFPFPIKWKINKTLFSRVAIIAVRTILKCVQV